MQDITTTPARPAFRKPWTHGAKAYYQADTFAALEEGARRKRKTFTLHMPNDGEAGDRPCASCGIALRDAYAVNPGEALTKVDTESTWTYNPRTRTAYGMHYYCSWGALLQRVIDLGRVMQL